ncbi:MAG: GPR endopeptidase [Ruminococcaceae bacterium]|nr:GPR endopeptidase [Oscillospiraceae bacterium]
MIRTDLAAEAAAYYRETDGRTPEGVRVQEYRRQGYAVTRVDVDDDCGAAAIGKPRGRYLTVELDALLHRESQSFARASMAIAEELRPLLPRDAADPVMVAGIGNAAITPDAIGPEAVRHTMVTRHMIARMPREFAAFRPVAAVCPGVPGTTGVETAELLRGVVERVRPAAMIVVDALASRRMARVCRTVQIADTGLSPGSGVGGDSIPLSRDTFGIPVIALGVPTVVDSLTLTIDTLLDVGQSIPEEVQLRRDHDRMIVTPRDIDARVAELGKLLGYALNLALHPGLTMEDMELYLA